METLETEKKNTKNRFAEIFITQIIAAIIILSTVLVVKFFFKGTYQELKTWYKENICIGTDINEVLK